MSSEADLLSQTESYFAAWNARDISALRLLFSADVELVDWNLKVSGDDKVTKANANIFDTFPNVLIDIVDALVCISKRAVTCEIIVHLNDEVNTKLNVVDVLRFNDESKISSVRAYKL